MLKKFALFALLIVISVPLFLHLDKLPFRLWDESRLAANAFEMNKDGNLIVTHYDGEPEMWSTKPPLMIWLQVAFIKLLGFNELAIRLPAAIAGLATCLFLLFFSKKLTGEYMTGAFATVVLVTTNGYIDIHAVRTGDYDGVLALFSTIFILSSILFFETKNKKWLKWFFAGITLAVLTKSVQPLLFLPGIFLYFLWRRKEILLARNITRPFLTEAFFCVLIVCSYYISREVLNPGYLNAVWQNELGGRYFEGLEENTGGSGYYAVRMPDYLFPYWIWFLPVSIISGLMSKYSRVKNLTIFLTVVTAFYFMLITLAKTKLYWYTVPLFPLFALQVAILLKQAYEFMRDRIQRRSWQLVLPALVVGILFIYPYYQVAKKVYRSKEYEWDNMYGISNVLQKALHGKASVQNMTICYPDFDQHLRIYAKALSDKGQHVTFKQPGQLTTGDTVMASQDSVYKQIQQQYDFELLKEEPGCRVYLLK